MVRALGSYPVYGGTGNDTVAAYPASFSNGELAQGLIYLGNGNDVGNFGRVQSTVFSGLGNDSIFGSFADDLTYGGADDDLITSFDGGVKGGGLGNDTLYSRGGADTFFFSGGRDVTTIFEAAADVLDLSDAVGFSNYDDLANTHLLVSNNEVTIIDDAVNSVLLGGATLDDLTAPNFIL